MYVCLYILYNFNPIIFWTLRIVWKIVFSSKIWYPNRWASVQQIEQHLEWENGSKPSSIWTIAHLHLSGNVTLLSKKWEINIIIIFRVLKCYYFSFVYIPKNVLFFSVPKVTGNKWLIANICWVRFWSWCVWLLRNNCSWN